MFTVQVRGPLQAALIAVALATTLCAGPTAAQAGSTPPHPKRDPMDAKAAVPAVQHRSALATYRAHAEQPVGSWREANETVNKVGGWRAYAREASQPDTPSTAPTAAPAAAPAAKPATAPPTPAGHAGHAKP